MRTVIVKFTDLRDEYLKEEYLMGVYLKEEYLMGVNLKEGYITELEVKEVDLISYLTSIVKNRIVGLVVTTQL